MCLLLCGAVTPHPIVAAARRRVGQGRIRPRQRALCSHGRAERRRHFFLLSGVTLRRMVDAAALRLAYADAVHRLVGSPAQLGRRRIIDLLHIPDLLTPMLSTDL